MIKFKITNREITQDKPHAQSGVLSFARTRILYAFWKLFSCKMSLKFRFYVMATCLVLLSTFFVEEVESRRVILTGRKAITRTYYKKPLIPAWATVTLVGIFMLVLGGGIYFLLNKIILGDLIRGPKFSKVAKSEAEV